MSRPSRRRPDYEHPFPAIKWHLDSCPNVDYYFPKICFRFHYHKNIFCLSKIMRNDLSLIIKLNLSLYSLYYAEACIELTGPISASLRPGNTAFLEEMSQQWRAVGSSVSDWKTQDLNLRPPAPKTNALLFDQLAGALQLFKTKIDLALYKDKSRWSKYTDIKQKIFSAEHCITCLFMQAGFVDYRDKQLKTCESFF